MKPVLEPLRSETTCLERAHTIFLAEGSALQLTEYVTKNHLS